MYIQDVLIGLFAGVFVIGAICTFYAARTRLGGRSPAVTARAAGAAALLNAAAAAAAVFSDPIFSCVHGISSRSGDELALGSLAVIAQVCYAIGCILLELRCGDGNDGRFASASFLALSGSHAMYSLGVILWLAPVLDYDVNHGTYKRLIAIAVIFEAALIFGRVVTGYMRRKGLDFGDMMSKALLYASFCIESVFMSVFMLDAFSQYGIYTIYLSGLCLLTLSGYFILRELFGAEAPGKAELTARYAAGWLGQFLVALSLVFLG